MTTKTLTKFALSAFATLIAAAGANAQSSSCALKLEVTRIDGGTVVRNASASIMNLKTKRRYAAILKGGAPVFVRLPEGSYSLSVSKTGFKRYASRADVSCTRGGDTFAVELDPLAGNYRQPPVVMRTETRNYDLGVDDSNKALDTGRPARPSGEVPKVVSGGVVNGKATNLVKPAYPAAARAVSASGAVNVQVLIDENGNVISAAAVSGHPLLRAAAIEAARASKFTPTVLSGVQVKVTGVIVYNFVP